MREGNRGNRADYVIYDEAQVFIEPPPPDLHWTPGPPPMSRYLRPACPARFDSMGDKRRHMKFAHIREGAS